MVESASLIAWRGGEQILWPLFRIWDTLAGRGSPFLLLVQRLYCGEHEQQHYITLNWNTKYYTGLQGEYNDEHFKSFVTSPINLVKCYLEM